MSPSCLPSCAPSSAPRTRSDLQFAFRHMWTRVNARNGEMAELCRAIYYLYIYICIFRQPTAQPLENVSTFGETSKINLTSSSTFCMSIILHNSTLSQTSEILRVPPSCAAKADNMVRDIDENLESSREPEVHLTERYQE